MASVDEVRASMARAAEIALQSLGHLQQAHDVLADARAATVQTAEASSQDTAHDAIALLSKAMSDIIEVQHTVTAATQTAQGYATNI